MLVRAGIDVGIAFATIGEGVTGLAGAIFRTLADLTDRFYGFAEGLASGAETILGGIPGIGDNLTETRERIQENRQKYSDIYGTIDDALTAAPKGFEGGGDFLRTLKGRFDEVAEEAISRAHAADEQALAELQAGNVSVTNVYEFNGPIVANNPSDLVQDARNMAGQVRVNNLIGMRRAV